MRGPSPELSRQLGQNVQNKHTDERAGTLGADQHGSMLWVPGGGGAGLGAAREAP